MRYLTRRGGLFLVTLWAALTVNFVIPRVMPGNEASAVLAHVPRCQPGRPARPEVEFGVDAHQGLYRQLLPVPRAHCSPASSASTLRACR